MKLRYFLLGMLRAFYVTVILVGGLIAYVGLTDPTIHPPTKTTCRSTIDAGTVTSVCTKDNQ